ncbi:MAG: hypothetical protein H6Q77_129 [Gemmatimonadetes bacterium]|nr:hypothetical protein [Gemmatimonadota bacterium]
MSRPTPSDLVFDPLADDRFPAIRDALARTGRDPRDRDAFLMVRESASLIRDLRPEGGVGEGMDQLAALVHHAYLFWAGARSVRSLDRAGLELLLSTELPPDLNDDALAWYLQLPERRVWAQALEGAAHEPLDGIFVHHAPAGDLRVLGVLGIHADRDGFTVVEATGPRLPGPARLDSAPFSSVLPGGAAAGLYSIAGAAELIELGWRSQALEQHPGTAAALRA